MCLGRCGDVPRIPSFPPNKGSKVLQGNILHTMDYSVLDERSAYELIKGKRVVAVGFQKSAMDFVVDCAEENQVNLLDNTYAIGVVFVIDTILWLLMASL